MKIAFIYNSFSTTLFREQFHDSNHEPDTPSLSISALVDAAAGASVLLFLFGWLPTSSLFLFVAARLLVVCHRHFAAPYDC